MNRKFSKEFNTNYKNIVLSVIQFIFMNRIYNTLNENLMHTFRFIFQFKVKNVKNK